MSLIVIKSDACTPIWQKSTYFLLFSLLSAALFYFRYHSGFKFFALIGLVCLLGLLSHLTTKRVCVFNSELNSLSHEKSIFGCKVANENAVKLADFSYVYVKKGQHSFELTLFSTIRDEVLLFDVDMENAESEAQRVAKILNLRNKGLLTSEGFSQ